MTIEAKNVMTRHRKSFEGGQRAAEEIRAALTAPPKVVLAHLTVNHRQPRFLEGLRSVLGPDIPLLGCSGQGVMGGGTVVEEGYAASTLALGGDALRISTARIDAIQEDTQEKGRALAKQLREGLGGEPSRVTLLYYDPLAGADMSPFLQELDRGLEGAVIGGAAAHFFSATMTTTYQYFGTEVFSNGAVAVSLAGDFGVHLANSSGVSPVGLAMKITKASGTMIQEFDGRPAIDVWKEVTGNDGVEDPIANAALALGLPVEGGSKEHMIRAAFVLGLDKGVMLQTAAPEGAVVHFYHRTQEDVLDGSRRLGDDLAAQLQGRSLKAVLGFECGGRTLPFLGTEATNQENGSLKARLGEAAYCGLIGWGEIYPVGGKTSFHNYAFPVLALSE